MKKTKEIKKKFFKQIQETKMHAISRFPAGIICGPLRGSFAVQFGDHLRRCTVVSSKSHFVNEIGWETFL